MDEFDNDISQMHNQIDIIKNNIDSMKYKSQKAMSSIIESINSLSKPKASKTTRSTQLTIKEKARSQLFNNVADSDIQPIDIGDIDQNLTKNYSNCFRQNNFDANLNMINNRLQTERLKQNYHTIHFQSPITTDPDPLEMMNIKSNSSNSNNIIDPNLIENNKSDVTLCYSTPTIKKEKVKNDYHNRTLSINVNSTNANINSIMKPNEITINNDQEYMSNNNHNNHNHNHTNSNRNNTMAIMTETNVNTQFKHPNAFPNRNMQIVMPQAYINSIKRHKRDKPCNAYNKSSGSNKTNSTHHDYAEGTYKKIVNELIEVLSSHNDETIQPNELVGKLKAYISKGKAKEDFVNNIKKLYLIDPYIDHNANVKVEVIDLWKWIQRLTQEDEDNQRNEVYKTYCEEIMNEYNLRSFEEMQVFVNEMLSKNYKNEKFVEGMKKILCNDPMKKKKVARFSSFNDTNHFNNRFFNHNHKDNSQNIQSKYK